MDQVIVRRQQINCWPRSIQANITRFYQRIIVPVVSDMPVHGMIVTGSMPDMNAYLDGCVTQVDNYAANEANKVYVMVLISL